MTGPRRRPPRPTGMVPVSGSLRRRPGDEGPIGPVEPEIEPDPGPVIEPLPEEPGPPPDPQRALRAAAPLLLLPLRLEYRVVDVSIPTRVTADVGAILGAEATVRAVTTPPPRRRPAPRTRAGRVSAAAASSATLAVSEFALRTRKEIWFRWFPEDDFAERGIAPATDEETQALATFDAAVAGKPWHSATDTTVVGAWQTLVRTVAPARAVHLLRNRVAAGDPQWEKRVGQIALLPSRVAIFAIESNGTVTALTEGTSIADVRYTPDALKDGGWLTNFEVALSKGMGCRLTDAQLVTTALAAEWIVAVGLSGDTAPDAAADAFARLMNDGIANGACEFLEPDIPTNNSGGTSSALTQPRADIPAFLARAAEAEAGLLTPSLEQSADLLGEALQLPAAVVRNAPGAADAALEDARAMLYVVGPVLFDSVSRSVLNWRGLAEDRILDFFAESIASRGTLPATRFGKNPYGILPVTRVTEVEPFAFDTADERRIDALLKTFLLTTRIGLLDPSRPAPPVIAPGDPDVANKLAEILKLNPVSRRLDVADTGAALTRTLGCAYVASAGWQPVDYLNALREKPLRQLADPDDSDAAAPLLYRLARLSLEKNIVLPVLSNTIAITGLLTLRTMNAPGADPAVDSRRNVISAVSAISLAGGAVITGTRADVAENVRRMAARIVQGLARLSAIAARPEGSARLEMLLMETIDLFQHRVDAWATGLAYRRIVRRRRAGRTGLAGGFYGMLGRLRPASATAGTDGYIQAPSPSQAATAALLRSAHLRHSAGPFAIDLSSARVRRAEYYLDLLRKGLTLGEALGHAGERFLHQAHRDDLIFPLRQRLPLRNVNDDASLEIRLFDGLAFLDANIASFPSDMQAPLSSLNTALADDLDTLADLVLAESVHQRSQGHTGAASAWLQVLSGAPVPGHPAVVRTVRSGHASSHRVTWLLDPTAGGNSPRAIAEPALARLATSAFKGFQTCSVAVETVAADATPGTTVNARLAADLGLEPIDLLIGGESELRVRAFNFAQRNGAGAGSMTLRTDGGNPTAAILIERATRLRAIVQQARVMDPLDLNAAARPDRPLTDAITAQLIGEAGVTLAARANVLGTRIAANIVTARTALSQFLLKARNYRNGVDANLAESQLALRFAAVETARKPFDEALVAVSRYGEPAALRAFTTVDVAFAPENFAPGFTSLLDRVVAKGVRVSAAAQAATATPADAAEARRIVASLKEALQSALDGEALPILPVILKRAETTAETDFSSGGNVANALGEWAELRARVRNASTVAATLTNVRAFATTDAATTVDDPEGDPRPETEAPRSRYFGTFLADRTFVAGAARYAGLVVDEWAEQRPSRSQTTGVAINYDSPQSEAPNCLLLCEPPNGDETVWTELSAARMVAETISWMKIRALPAQRRLAPGGQLPQINQVPFKPGAGGGTRRVPTRPLIRVGGPVFEGAFVAAALGQPAGLAATGAQEISRLSRSEE
jgi:hypothetical protein